MVQKVETFSVCSDCYVLEGTGDSTFLDHAYDPKEAEERLNEIEGGFKRLTASGGHLVTGDTLDEFSKSPCECCGSTLAGARFELHLLK